MISVVAAIQLETKMAILSLPLSAGGSPRARKATAEVSPVTSTVALETIWLFHHSVNGIGCNDYVA
jgi:hypothetical protein